MHCRVISLAVLMAISSSLYAELEPHPYEMYQKNFEATGIEESLWKMHYELYKGYVKNTEIIEQRLQENSPEDTPLSIDTRQALERRWSWERNGMVLHELFFENVGKSEYSTSSPLIQAIREKYSSVEKLVEAMKNLCKMRGIGWGVLYQDCTKGGLHLDWIDEHSIGPLVDATPLLVIDVWEHAYLTQFGIDRGRYLDTIFQSIKWDVVEKRYESRCLEKDSQPVKAPTKKESHDPKKSQHPRW